jgi:uncharacterized protein (TIGR00255 family)
MILSMTGYGDAHHSDGKVSYVLEIRSLNNRYFKASIKLPEHLSIFEAEVEKMLRERITRGSLSCSLRQRHMSAEAAQDINVPALENYLAQLNRVVSQGHMQVDLGALLALPGVCEPPEMDDAERERQLRIIQGLVSEALTRLIEMRRIEGRTIRDDLFEHCGQIRGHLTEVGTRAPLVLREYHLRLLQRVNELISEARLQLQLDDLKREVALYAERCDINEEIARLTAHLDQFERLCDSNEAAGRKLDFLAQELLRETNTIGSKANDATIAHHVVEIKGAIDRLKEQVQNVE